MTNKSEYIFADYFRLVCAVGVVALHLDPFYDINEYANFFVGSVLARLCVPFFFLLSGFFLKTKLSDWSRLKKYVGHLVKLYLVYTLLYLPVIYCEYKDNEKPFAEDAVSFIKKFLFVGSYGQLWYFLALIFAVIFIHWMVTKVQIDEKLMVLITVVLFLIGLFFRVYDKPIRDTVDSIKIVELYDSIFKTTRNGLFFGTPFVYWGNLIWKKKINIDRKKFGVGFVVFLFALSLEAVFVRKVIGARQLDMLVLLPGAAIFLVLLVLSKSRYSAEKEMGIWCRKLSVLIFGFHLLIHYVVERILESQGLTVNSFCVFLIVLTFNLLAGMLLILSSKQSRLSWIDTIFL